MSTLFSESTYTIIGVVGIILTILGGIAGISGIAPIYDEYVTGFVNFVFDVIVFGVFAALSWAMLRLLGSIFTVIIVWIYIQITGRN